MEGESVDGGGTPMEENDTTISADDFITGVIEGFYNRPWTREQRLDLFIKLGKWGLNSYLYAPKDDSKHRARWRELYTPEECDQLKELVDAADKQGVTFYYGISPGQDMRYCESKEQDLLEAKTRQLQQLGCKGFAVLWDDIEPELTEEDAKHFTSFAEAHCKVTNSLHEALERPKMLLCPVEYCSSRAVPDVADSEYLATLGNTLHPDIKVFWTGANVVSATITASECHELAKVLKRQPLIWDNLHANDYDQSRLLLGPYIGRDAEPRKYLAGAMTNPNCEYSLNIPAILSLADWAGVSGHHWEPSGLASQARAVTALLEESRREGWGPPQRQLDDDGLTEDDWDVVCQFFWLPHSHGPMVERLLEDFRWCRDTAPAVRGWRRLTPGEQADTVDTWIDKAARVNSINKQFAFICDVITKIPNRELLYDLIPYLTNVRVILSACSRYLQWVGLRDCRKPLRCGPTLAGLPGGVAGDLMRLYPVQSMDQFPLTGPPPTSSFTVLPFHYKPGKEEAQELEVQACLGEDLTTWGPLVAKAKHSLMARQEGEVVGMLSAWQVDTLKEEREEPAKKHVNALQDLKGVKTMARLWGRRDSLAWLLQPSLLLEVMTSVTDGDGGVAVSLATSQHALVAILKLLEFKEFKHKDFKSGQHLLWRELP